ncbi:MAG: hypothetical protein PHH54_00030 [Candidatus Nanoarchaeia archaeon]|nr:hypothetical protein [Candidatus Nanoarchaeia archaeon]MDD5740350.1 hypothetical protein [Candidatus Nanoarchaeia archaeon]
MIWFSGTNIKEIKSPVIGIFYDAAISELHEEYNPKPYVEVGSPVTPETIICEIEALAVMLPVKAEVYGTIEEKLVCSGEAVDYGQVLFKINSSG